MLIVGGGSSFASAFYNPATNSFTVGPNNIGAREFHAAAKLADGRLLVVGGVPAAAPEIWPKPTRRHSPPGAFRDVAVGRQSPALLLPVANSGSNGLIVQAVAISGPDAADFSVEPSDCLLPLVEPGASCLLAVQFRPSSAGPKSATLTLTDDAKPSPAIALTGGGVAAEAGPPGTDGEDGKNAKVTCDVKKAKGTKKVKVTCTVKRKTSRRARLMRNRRVYARGSARRLVATRAVRPGRYVLPIGQRLRLTVRVG